jgi:hypothetical protein
VKDLVFLGALSNLKSQATRAMMTAPMRMERTIFFFISGVNGAKSIYFKIQSALRLHKRILGKK